MSGNTLLYVIFALGVIVGGIIFSATFRVKFFKGLRKFIGQLGSGAKKQNKHYQQDEQPNKKAESIDSGRVQHIYKRTHTSRICETCKGSGRVYKKASPLIEGAIGYKPKVIDCPDCNGEGIIYN